MKLLIVDDEEMTREGLVSSIDWEKLGITGIRQANDGINGLEAAKEWRPDIILCDVRMPRMDGIKMLEQIEAFLPNIAAIFMSGFSDKEYLKAAIRLKAINYIEKPIDPAEITETVLNAVKQCREHQKHKEHESSDHVSEQLAYCLTLPYSTCQETVERHLKQFNAHHRADRFRAVTTFILKLENSPEHPDVLPAALKGLKKYLAPMHLHIICSDKRLRHLVFHVYGQHKPSSGTLIMVAEKILEAFSFCENRCIAIGPTVPGISQVYSSYQAAVITLQSSFFFEPESILSYDDISVLPSVDADMISSRARDYINALDEADEKAAAEALSDIKKMLHHSSGLLLNQLKGIYYDMFRHLLSSDFATENQDNIMDIMDSCFFFCRLHQVLEEKTAAYFREFKNSSSENSIIRIIRSYIGTHYRSTELSVKSISDHVNRSASYTCTLFKNETGLTLNQYITDFRMKRAAQLLADPRNRISDISESVGYSDGNYFGKSFRKYTGFSPSEYREQVLRK
jgi:two-component system response regulator YesN